ncbi:Thymidylate kinase [uncultured Candidatus Thioglobus sp.]|nr:Thymidylate kinase [uncultured Candidatus Thioglobus sp.]
MCYIRGMHNIDDRNVDRASTVAQNPDATVHRFEFRGTTAEYFKIWLVNTALTILTLGIYAAWAKVRTKRYFYGNTFLDGANFDYHARPLSILIARLFVFAIIAGGGYWAESSGMLENIFYSVALLVFFPWAFVRGLSFNARNSSFCRIRFYFRRDYALPYVYYLLMATGVGFLVLPWLARHYHQFKSSRHQLGELRFNFNQPSAWFYVVIFWLMMPIALVLLIVCGYLVFSGNELLRWGVIPLVVVFFAVILHAQAWLFLLFWKNISAENGAIFRCNFSTLEFAYNILAVNYIAVLLSLGLLYPWAQVRKTNFLATRMSIVAAPDVMDNILGMRTENEGALGEEFADAEGFDFDVGLI